MFQTPHPLYEKVRKKSKKKYKKKVKSNCISLRVKKRIYNEANHKPDPDYYIQSLNAIKLRIEKGGVLINIEIFIVLGTPLTVFNPKCRLLMACFAMLKDNMSLFLNE